MQHADINHGTQGAKRQSWDENSPRSELDRLVKLYGPDKQTTIREELRNTVADNEAMAAAVYDYWFANNWHSLVKRDFAPAAKVAEERQQRKATIKEAATALKETVTRAVHEEARALLMDFELPDGTLLRDATFAQVKKASAYHGHKSSWLAKISGMGSPRQVVGRTLTEAQLPKR